MYKWDKEGHNNKVVEGSHCELCNEVVGENPVLVKRVEVKKDFARLLYRHRGKCPEKGLTLETEALRPKA